MKNITIVILLINGFLLSSAVQGQNQQNGSKKRQFGAPNTVRNQGQTTGQKNRKTARKPFGSRNQGQQKGQDGSTRKPQPGGKNRGQTGMEHKPKPKLNLREVLGLTEEQVKALRAAREEWHILAKSIRENKELSDEEKRAQLKEGFKEFDAKVREILTEEQYSKLREIRRQKSRPNNNGNEQNGNSRAEHRHGRELRRILELTEEQIEKFRAVHQYATKKIKAIIANEELTREEKKEQIKEVKKQAHNRRMEILTEEQKEKLHQWRARHRAQHQQQGGNQEQGRPQQGGNQEQGRPQRRPQGGGQEQGRPQQGGQKGGQKGRPQQGGQKGGQKGRPQQGGQKGGQKGRPQQGGQKGGQKGRPQQGGQKGGQKGRPQQGGQKGGQKGRPQPRNR